MMREPTAFFVKSRPQGADLFQLVDQVKRVFIGYPPWRRDATWDRAAVRSCMIDLSARDATDELAPHLGAAYKRCVTQNQNLIEKVGPGSICCVPRPGAGIVYLCKVGDFELCDRPTWIESYLAQRAEQGLAAHDKEKTEQDLVGDVVQSWPIAEGRLVAVPFTSVPRWILYRLLSRNTSGLLHKLPDDPRTPFDVLDALYRGTYIERFEPTTDRREVEARMTDLLSPTAFEHLVVELLQLEAPAGVRWWHVGGSGDGGADGLAADAGGTFAALQCKWKYDGDPAALGQSLRDQMRNRPHPYMRSDSPTAVVAVLLGKGQATQAGEGVVVLTRSDIAALLIKHRDRCGMARTLGIGT